MSKTQVTTGKVRFSYVNAFVPKAISENAEPKYSVTLLIPKHDKKTLDKINAAMEEAKKVFKEKNPSRKLPANLKTTIHDGDEPKESGEDFSAECKGNYVITVSSNRRPLILYADKTVMTEPTELYSGCYGRAVINFYVYDTAGSIGITAGLNGLMKLEDGEPLSGGRITEADFDDDWDDWDTGDSLLD